MWIRNVLFFFSQCLSFSPILTLSDDRFFGKIDRSNFDKNHIRCSLISFKLGIRSFYFITIKRGEKIKLFFSQNLYKIQDYPNVIKIDNAYDVYKIELQSLSEDTKLVHKETLLYKISEVEKVINKTFNKFLAYLALIVFIIPLFSDYFEDIFKYKEIYQVIFISILSYQCLNIMFFSYSFIKIKSVERVTFKSVRYSIEPLNTFILMLYYELRSQSQESTMQVSLMRNIEKYIVAIVISSSIFLVTHNSINFLQEVSKPHIESSTPSTLPKSKINSINKLCLNEFQLNINKPQLPEESKLLIPTICSKAINKPTFKKGE